MLDLIEGFDHMQYNLLSTKGWTEVISGIGMTGGSISTGRITGHAIHFDAGAANNGSITTLTKILPSSYTTLISGFAWKSTVFPASTNEFFKLMAGGTSTVKIALDGSNKLIVQNSAGTTLATGTTTIATNTWYFIELKAFVNGASGTIELHLNGVSEIGSTTVNIGSSNLDRIVFVNQKNGVNATADFDDTYVCDTTGGVNNSFLGDVTVETLYPNGDGAHTDFTPDTGVTHYNRVNESSSTYPDGDTSYVASATLNAIDTYGYTDLSVLLGTVYGVQTNLYARKDDVSTRQVAPVVRKSSTDYVGNNSTLSTSYSDYTQIYDQDPTSTPWTIASVNAAEFGIKVTT